ncbi:hypothetical protein OAH12_00060 [Cyclobacteriaceae bacterium]|nr:hypothetical protein [Cyclobacteriaceae bacterium]
MIVLKYRIIAKIRHFIKNNQYRRPTLLQLIIILVPHSVFLSKIFITYSLLFYTFLSFSQNQKVVQYYGTDSTRIKNLFYVLKQTPNTLNGPITQFYESGILKTKGQYTLNKPSGTWTYYYESGEEKYVSIFLKDGNAYWKYYYENGQLMKEGLLDGKKEEGHWAYYYENGMIHQTGDFYNGQMQGKWIHFYEDSVIKGEAIYENGTGYYKEFYYDGTVQKEGPLVNNQSEGMWTYYYPDGTIQAEGFELDGKKTGNWKYYHTNGTISSNGAYSKGSKNGDWVYYYPSGEVYTEGTVDNNEREGNWTIFNTDGSYQGVITYKDNEGTYTEYYPNNQVKASGKFIGGEHEGVWTYYYENGELEAECNYSHDEGDYHSYYQDGKPKSDGIITGNQRTGLWKLYDKDGKVIYYRNVAQDDQTESDTLKIEPIKPSKATTKGKFVYKQQKKWRKGVRWLTPKPKEARGFILGGNPFALIGNSLPISIEYFIQERQGYQFRYHFIRQPFFKEHSSVPAESIYKTGNIFDLSMKVYSINFDHGMWYMGPSTRFSQINYFSNALTTPSDSNSATQTISASERTYELVFVGGNRIIKSFKQRGFTLEVYAGVGIGYREFNKKFDISNDYYNSLFKDVSQGKIFAPVRLGFSIGYFFL